LPLKAVSVGAIGVVAIAAVTARDAPFWRDWCLRASSESSRRRFERSSESCHRSVEERSLCAGATDNLLADPGCAYEVS
jgi:hypothetical protein